MVIKRLSVGPFFSLLSLLLFDRRLPHILQLLPHAASYIPYVPPLPPIPFHAPKKPQTCRHTAKKPLAIINDRRMPQPGGGNCQAAAAGPALKVCCHYNHYNADIQASRFITYRQLELTYFQHKQVKTKRLLIGS